MDRRVAVVHREVALTRKEVGNARGEIADLRKLVVGDHAPRLTQVEAKTSRITLPPAAKAGGIGAGAGGIVVLLVEVIIPLVSQLLEGK
jgi:hypothetical protein